MSTKKLKVWSPSIREELLGTLKLIAGLLAWNADIKWLAWLCFVLAGADILLSIRFAIAEIGELEADKDKHEAKS